MERIYKILKNKEHFFEYGKAKNKYDWCFYLKSPKGKIIFKSDYYNSKQECLNKIIQLKKYAESANINYEEDMEQF